MANVKSFQELYDNFITELQSQRPDLTDTHEGSTIDVIAGVTSLAVNEIQQIVLDQFAKTFFATANGPEVTGSTDDLETLAVDHFGDSFARPESVKATGTITFSRPSAAPGNIVIPSGTIVKTAPNASGVAQRFETTADVTITGTSINASVRALTAGTDGNVQANKVTLIETTLTDTTITVNNSAAFTGGDDTETDAEYRETIRNLIETLRGATLAAIEAKAKTVAGVEKATGIEFQQYVKEWNISSNTGVGSYFKISRAKIYIADANGTASQTLINDVKTAIETTRAAGVFVEVIGATPVSQDWELNITLNPSGPNYATLQSDAQMIVDTMIKYIQDLAIGTDFIRATAEAYIMSLWGPSGTNDLTAVDTDTPVGDVSVDVDEKLIPGTVAVV